MTSAMAHLGTTRAPSSKPHLSEHSLWSVTTLACKLSVCPGSSHEALLHLLKSTQLCEDEVGAEAHNVQVAVLALHGRGSFLPRVSAHTDRSLPQVAEGAGRVTHSTGLC